MAAVLVVAAAAVVYAQSFRAPFHLDDLYAIASNSYIRINSLSPDRLLAAAFQDFRQNRPLTNLSFALNYYFNLVNPAGYHAVNFALLALTALLIGLWLQKLMTHLGFEATRSRLAAWLIALLWVLHPANVQSTTYLVQRHASMAGLFSVAALYFFHLGRGQNSGRLLFYMACGLSCALALLSKETALTLPLVILAYQAYFFEGLEPGWIRRNWKWAAGLTIFYAAAAALVLRPSMRSLIFDFNDLPFTAPQKVLSAARVAFWAAAQVVFPIPQRLNLLHDFPASRSLFQPATTAAAWLLAAAVIFAAIVRARKWKIFSFAVTWFLAMNLVELMPLPIDLVSEQRLYLASLAIIGPAIGLAVLRPHKIGVAIGWILVIASFFGFFTFARNRVWLSEESLWRDVAGKSPAVAMWWNHLCASLVDAGKLKEAVNACEEALSLDPKLSPAHQNLGNVLLRLGDLSRAEAEFEQAAKYDPKDALSYFHLGLVKFARNDFAGGRAMFAKAEQLNPAEARIYYNMGVVYESIGSPVEAGRRFRMALDRRPEWLEPRVKLVSVLVSFGLCAEARELAYTSPVRDPDMEALAAECVERTGP